MACQLFRLVLKFVVARLLVNEDLAGQNKLSVLEDACWKDVFVSRHNDVRVHRYNVVYRSPEGEVVETFFDTDDFNVYPWKNRPKYPTLNQRFTLKYLPRLPQYIIIMTDLEAEHCQELKMKLAEAERKLSFEATNTEFIKQVEDYQNQVQAHCSKQSV